MNPIPCIVEAEYKQLRRQLRIGDARPWSPLTKRELQLCYQTDNPLLSRRGEVPTERKALAQYNDLQWQFAEIREVSIQWGQQLIDVDKAAQNFYPVFSFYAEDLRSGNSW